MVHSELATLVQRFNAVVNGRASSRSLMLMHESGLTFPQIIVLYVLDSQGAQSISRIAEVTRLSAPAASQMIDKLVASGYLSRQEDASDRRMRVVAMRPKGTKFLEQLNQTRRDEIERACAPLPQLLRTRLTQVLSDVVAHFDKAGVP
jgi:DNA-binding MarR family transcriptional regulator